jgi:DNA-directed RNA polymerase subunit RPC12/RpoP
MFLVPKLTEPTTKAKLAKVSGAKLEGLRLTLCQPVIERRIETRMTSNIKTIAEYWISDMHCCGSQLKVRLINDIENQEKYLLVNCRECSITIEIKKRPIKESRTHKTPTV